jgi:hypothetical protein
MKGFLYCFRVVEKAISKDSIHTNIFKVSTTVRNISEVLQESNDKQTHNSLIFEFAVEFEDIQFLSKLEIFEKLYIYKLHNTEDYYKIDLTYIKKFINDDIKAYDLQKRKLSVIKRFLKSTIQKNDNFGYNKAFIFSLKHFAHLNYEIQTLKISDLYEVYKHWCKINHIKDKAEICEFFDLCESHTFLGKANEDYEWEFVSLKTTSGFYMNSHSYV